MTTSIPSPSSTSSSPDHTTNIYLPNYPVCVDARGVHSGDACASQRRQRSDPRPHQRRAHQDHTPRPRRDPARKAIPVTASSSSSHPTRPRHPSTHASPGPPSRRALGRQGKVPAAECPQVPAPTNVRSYVRPRGRDTRSADFTLERQHVPQAAPVLAIATRRVAWPVSCQIHAPLCLLRPAERAGGWTLAARSPRDLPHALSGGPSPCPCGCGCSAQSSAPGCG
ncbi:hypothetical protein C8Q78DRAFT_517635 [Trametes maxima]|nr:hypothetical protein C8Q78DRAFT_517635 [Trametes maxima]